MSNFKATKPNNFAIL